MRLAILLIALMLPLGGASCKNKEGQAVSRGSQAYSKAWERCITPIRKANEEAGIQTIESGKWTHCEELALKASRKAWGKRVPEQASGEASGEEQEPERKRGKVRCFFAKAVAILPFVKNSCAPGDS